MRLDKFLCNSAGLSREQALVVISEQRVMVNGNICDEANRQVHESNVVNLDGKPLTLKPFRYFMIHKQAGTICSNVDERYPSVFSGSGLAMSETLHVVGRLDADTTGLVLATDDGRWSFNITRPDQNCGKVYRVSLRKPIKLQDADAITEKFRQGIVLQNQSKPTLPAVFQRVDDHTALLTIVEGKFHQVKQMFAAIGNKVVSLHRCQIGEVVLDIAEGEWRELTATEIAALARYEQGR